MHIKLYDVANNLEKTCFASRGFVCMSIKCVMIYLSNQKKLLQLVSHSQLSVEIDSPLLTCCVLTFLFPFNIPPHTVCFL